MNRFFSYKIAFLLIGITLLVQSGCCPYSIENSQCRKSDHFDGVKFHNQNDIKMIDPIDMLEWALERKPGDWPFWIKSKPGPKPPGRIGTGELRVTFINHSTVLLQFDSLNILTDPVWSYRVSPVDLVGPTRKRDPGIKFEDLPKIDYVVISHNHYDHMDLPTLKMLRDKFNPVFIVPLGNKLFLNSNGFPNTQELDWWNETNCLHSVKITFVPSQHFTMRGLCDRNETLWGGYVFSSTAGPIYFAGDTGFGIHFQQIYEHFGQLRFAMLPIGAYIPRKYVAPMHISPDEAVEAHKILHSKWSMAIHFGTFQQAEDGLLDPINDLKKAMKANNLTSRDFSVFEHGKGYMIPKLENLLRSGK